MTKDIDQLFDTYIDQEFGGRFRTEGCSGVRNLEKICRDLGYRHGQFIGEHYIANFLADNPAAIEMLFKYIRDATCGFPRGDWSEALDLESYRDAADADNEFVVEDDTFVSSN
jgi:hypothetical protein